MLVPNPHTINYSNESSSNSSSSSSMMHGATQDLSSIIQLLLSPLTESIKVERILRQLFIQSVDKLTHTQTISQQCRRIVLLTEQYELFDSNAPPINEKEETAFGRTAEENFLFSSLTNDEQNIQGSNPVQLENSKAWHCTAAQFLLHMNPAILHCSPEELPFLHLLEQIFAT